MPGAPRLKNSQHKALRHLPIAVEELKRRASAAISQSGKAHLYEMIVQDDPTTKRARVYIRARGLEGMLDDAQNSTILKMQAFIRAMK